MGLGKKRNPHKADLFCCGGYRIARLQQIKNFFEFFWSLFVFVTFATCYFSEFAGKAQAYFIKIIKNKAVWQKPARGRILTSMSIFVQSTPPPHVRAESAVRIAPFYAALLVVAVLTQLFSFDSFVELFISFNLPLSDSWSYALAPVIVAAEIFAIPFLLRMRLSIAFRWFSMLLGWLVPALWLYLSFWTTIESPDVRTLGFLGTVVNLTPGWWAVGASIFVGVLAGWVSRGMWPAPLSKSKK